MLMRIVVVGTVRHILCFVDRQVLLMPLLALIVFDLLLLLADIVLMRILPDVALRRVIANALRDKALLIEQVRSTLVSLELEYSLILLHQLLGTMDASLSVTVLVIAKLEVVFAL